MIFVKDTTYFVVRSGGALAGIYGLTIKGPVVKLRNALTLPEYRGQGIGRFMLQFRLRYAQNAGCTKAEAFVTASALSNFLALGFTAGRKTHVSTHVKLQLD